MNKSLYMLSIFLLSASFLNSYASTQERLITEFENDLTQVTETSDESLAAELAQKWYAKEDVERTLQLHTARFGLLIEYIQIFMVKYNGQPAIVHLLKMLIEQGFYKEALEFQAIYVQKWHEEEDLYAECCVLMLSEYVIPLAELFIQKGVPRAAELFMNTALDYYLKTLKNELKVEKSTWHYNYNQGGFTFGNQLTAILKYALAEKVYTEIIKSEELLPNLRANISSINSNELEAVFAGKALFTETQFSDLPKFLASFIYYASDALERGEDCIEVETLRSDVETIFCDILKKDRRTTAILCAIALYAQKNPFYRIIFNAEPVDVGFEPEGIYWPNLKKVHINGFFDLAKLKQALIHELTHQLMDIIYQNDANPYYKFKETLEAPEQYKAYERVAEGLEWFSSENKEINQMFSAVTEHYSRSHYHCEYIVRLPEAIVVNREIVENTPGLQALYAYWDQYIAADIDAFIREKLPSSEAWMQALIAQEYNYAAY